MLKSTNCLYITMELTANSSNTSNPNSTINAQVTPTYATQYTDDSTWGNVSTELRTLIAGCVAEDRLCQKKLYETYYSKMMSVCNRYTATPDEALDVLHEGFLKVFKNIGTYIPRNSLESWIKRIMINAAIDYYRRHKKFKNETDLEYARYELDHDTADILSQISVAQILKMVQQLPPAYRTVFNLYVIEGFTHREIAEKLDITEGTSKSNLAKARFKMQAFIKNNK